MSSRSVLIPATTLIVILAAAAALAVAVPSAQAGTVSCAPTSDPTAPTAPSAGHPCWSDVTPYPFGSDGNPGDPSDVCGVDPACELQVTSMAFRAWNRGLAATSYPPHTDTGNVAYGVWLYNGTSWYPDPTFPGSASCPGSTVLWAGKLDYWLIGGPTETSGQTLCRFDGVNLTWEALPLPPATLARLPIDSNTGKPAGGITSGACYAWNNCWFFGDDGIEVHWDGQVLSDASSGLGTSPWLDGDFTGAVAQTDPSGNEFGLAVSDSGENTLLSSGGGGQPLPSQPDGSPPPQLFGSRGGPFAPLAFSPPTTAQPGDPFRTDLTAVASDPKGDAWVAGDPTSREQLRQPQPAPLLRLTGRGAPAPCAGYGASTFTYEPYVPFPPGGVYQWTSLSVFPNDGSVLAGAEYKTNGDPEPLFQLSPYDDEPGLIQAACGQSPSMTLFRVPDPLYPDPATAPLIPADLGGSTAAVAANADNDAWAATTVGKVGYVSNGTTSAIVQPPHLYHWTDGQPPDAPAGDDHEPRPSLLTPDAPVYVPAAPTVVVLPPAVTTTSKQGKTKKIKLKPAIYAVKSKLRRARNGVLTLYITFKVRRPLTIGVEGLRGSKVVASSGMRRFTGRRGQLAMRLNPKRWPSRLAFVTPKARPATRRTAG